MPDRITFEHSVLSSGQHAVKSPEVRGFVVVGAPGASKNDVLKQALDALVLLRTRQAGQRAIISAIEFESA